MRYFLDCEFNGFDGPLISIALVPEQEDRGSFYAVLPCHRPLKWVAEHVMPRLGGSPRSRADVVAALTAYLLPDPAPCLVADWPEDIAHAAALLAFQGRRQVPNVRFDLLSLPGFDTASMSLVPHNALADAEALRREVLAREAKAPGHVAA
ncbi:hypothetical protein [Sandarakinorhabdus rubra]|uniref:hypothetical protein n=1 Tax=Sandarakinorhabdus rubra TaxID=2672568 RepID=UPI0013DA313F|nr:hypothetical protein [Sandarakinorhabdus rubra]